MKEVQHARRPSFVELRETTPDQLAVGSYGLAGTGKTALIASALQLGNVGVIPLDRKTRRTLAKEAEKYKKTGNKLLFPPNDFVRHAKPMELALMQPAEAMTYYSAHLSRVQDAIFTLAERKDVQVIAIDSGTQLWEDIMFKHFGRAQRVMPRDRGAPNQDMKDILNSLQDKHLIITHQASEVWRNDKPTGKYEWSGWSKLDYYCNVIVEHEFNEKESEEEQFSLTVRLCQDRPDLIGERVLTGPDVNFLMLATTIYPEGEWS